MLLAGGLQLLDLGQVRLQVQLALVGIQQHLLAVGQVQHLHGHAADRGQAQGPRQDRNVAGSTAAHRDETQHLACIEAGGLRRGELFGNQDRLLRQVPGAVLDPEDQLQHPLADVGQVRRALGEQGVAQALEQRGGGDGRTVPGKRCTLALGQ